MADQIHILFHGESYCKQPGVPGKWPEGHHWVYVDEYEKSNCDLCRDTLLEGAVLCDKCKMVLVDGHGRIVGEGRSNTGVACHPCCSQRRLAGNSS